MRARPALWGEGLGNDPSYPALRLQLHLALGPARGQDPVAPFARDAIMGLRDQQAGEPASSRESSRERKILDRPVKLRDQASVGEREDALLRNEVNAGWTPPVVEQGQERETGRPVDG